MAYYSLKLTHLISASILFGTGLGIAYFMFKAVRSRNIPVIKQTLEHVVIADWVFTTPAVIIQLISGIALMKTLNYSFDSIWFYWVISLYTLIGICWLPVVYIQIALRKCILDVENNQLPDQFHKLFNLWFILGIPAFLLMLAIFYFMVFKPYIT